MHKKRSGMTLVETIIALALMGMAVIVMARLTASRIADTENLGKQFAVKAADAYIYGIYQDFHDCNGYEIVRADDDLSQVQLIFDLGSEGSHIYSYSPSDGHAYMNGVMQFPCNAFVLRGTTEELFVSVKLENEQRLEVNMRK